MFIPELRSILENAGIVTAGTTFFNTSLASIPLDDGPFLLVRETTGLAPDLIQNQAMPAYVYPQAQIQAVGADPMAVRRLIYDAYRALTVIRNQYVGSSTQKVTLTRAGAVVSAVSLLPHEWASGYQPVISGAVETAYNGTKTITVTGDNSFTFPISGTPTTPATGTITAAYPGTWYRSIKALQDPSNLSLDNGERTRFVFNIRADKVLS